ncbi:hypothetical protein PHLGIDRAFT_487210 [Phlebiopsis gigantea 11061_1 CR5-6]|uniref:Heterokaryon incompatibility domain-containing protein n=1 Tax=Phlebiopsis gigantea (strain 11061_1 CR5-6) TaxID=745531 RepID=A0A0C3S5Q3_PHLG1|nr:hypothetical protein PHLGIDRAFT_487210 [Phlebiopsis gigantea 11061_1 CR5-6]
MTHYNTPVSFDAFLRGGPRESYGRYEATRAESRVALEPIRLRNDDAGMPLIPQAEDAEVLHESNDVPDGGPRPAVKVPSSQVPYKSVPVAELHRTMSSVQRSVRAEDFLLPETPEGKRRSDLWSRVQRARTASGDLDETLFTMTPPPDAPSRTDPYRLQPPVEEGLNVRDMPLQLLHINPVTIPFELADKPCKDMTAAQLLAELNDIFGTQRTMESAPGPAGLEACLQEFIDDECDVGLAYGYLRRVWRSDAALSRFREDLAVLKDEDMALRRAAFDTDRVTKPQVPPRRVWDLYSNRVLPWYSLGFRNGHIPENVWAVSHSWVDRTERQYVRTPVNGCEWPVALPYVTTLHRVRIELLNMGAEYVFLDIVCNRQRDELSQANEFRREREWRIDVPTMGHVYRHSPCQITVIYFNGLGRPVDLLPNVFESEYHWFNRVWTLQEVNTHWLMGGLWAEFNADPKADGKRLLNLLHGTLKIVDGEPDILELLTAVKARPGSSAPVDQVAALGYLLQCETMPIYRAKMPAEEAWSLLIEDLRGVQRLHLLLSYAAPGTIDAWRPSWAQVMGQEPDRVLLTSQLSGALLVPYHLSFLNRYSAKLGYKHLSDVYFHRAVVVHGYRVERMEAESVSGKTHVTLSVTGRTPSQNIEIAMSGATTLTVGTEVVAVRIAGSGIGLIGELLGRRRVAADSAIVVRKIAVVMLPPSHSLGQPSEDVSSCVVYV